MVLTVMPKSIPTTISGVKVSNPMVILRFSSILDHEMTTKTNSWPKKTDASRGPLGR